MHDSQNGNEFDQYLGTTPSIPIQGQRWAQSAIRQVPGRSPLGGLPYNGSSQALLVQGDAVAGAEAKAASSSGTVADAKPITGSGSGVDSPVASEQARPISERP